MTQATMARPHVPRRTLPPFSVIALFVLGALLCAAMAYVLRDPALVDQVTVDNPSSLEVSVDVRPSITGARLAVAAVPPDSQATTRDVLDQGDDWIFSFSSGGIEGGDLHVTRTQLAADGWRVVVPARVIDRLQSGSFVPADR
jgi:hypothetical protein